MTTVAEKTLVVPGIFNQFTEKYVSGEQLMTDRGFNFTVAKEPIFLASGLQVKENFAVVRSDNGRGIAVVGKDYKCYQHTEVVSVTDQIVARSESIYTGAGILKDGRRFYLLAKLPGEIRVGAFDTVDKFLCFSGSHDGTTPLCMGFTAHRPVCMNTLAAATKDCQFRIRHSANITEGVEQAIQDMQITNTLYADLGQAYNAMLDKKLNGAETRDFLNRCFDIQDEEEASTRIKNQRDEVLRLVETGLGSDLPGVRGSVWGTYNALTEFVDHRDYRNEDGRVESILFNGSGGKLKLKAFEQAVSMVR